MHRDVKPANILIENSSGVAKLADFGIVKAPWAAKTQEGDTLGSPGYMSPEQIDGSELDERADLFCLGVVLYQMLSGRHPFLRDTVAGTAYATCNGAYTPLREIVSSVPPALDWAVRKCLAVDRKKRIGSAKELLSLLKTVVPSSGGPGQTPAEKKPAQKLKGATKRDFVHYLVKPFTVRHEPADDRLLWFKIKHWFHRVEKPVVGLWKSMRAMVRRADRSRRAFFLFWVSMAVIIIIICAIGIGFIINPPALPPENSVEGKLFRQCSEALEKSNREAALEAGNKLTSMNPIHPQSWIVLARIMIREGKYDVAANELKRVPSLKGGKKTLKKALPAILLEICRQMKKGPAPPSLLDMAVYTLSAGANPLVRSWIQDTNHWLRWNAVEVLKMSNSDIDIVPVYIQDLSFAGSVQVRLAAVDSLGEIGDKRAIPALKKVMALDQNDPLASAEAGKVLEEKFK